MCPVVRLAERGTADLVVVGPKPVVLGFVALALEARGIRNFGPGQEASAYRGLQDHEAILRAP